jgi:superfamily I DNA and RNA helicase
LGFGIYRKGGLVQIFENKDLWFDIGYESTADIIEDNEEITLSRTPISSPGFLEQHSSIDDLIIFKDFESEEAQAKWLADEIAKNIQEDELLPDDIVVINPDPFTTREAVGLPRKLLLQQGINSNLAGVTTIADVFTEPGTVTFTGIYRAKGNEAPMVYVINAHSCVGHLLPGDMAIARNRLFTAITRSKAWVRVLGVGKKMTSLISEFQNVKDERFALRFRYPTEEERKTMRTVNRDTSQAERERSTRRRQNLLDIIESLDSGESVLEDYPEELMHRLEAYFEKREKRNRKKA